MVILPCNYLYISMPEVMYLIVRNLRSLAQFLEL